MVSVRPPSLPAPSFPHTSPCLSFSLPHSLPSLSPPSLPSFPLQVPPSLLLPSLLPLFQGEWGGGRGAGAQGRSPLGGVSFIRKPASPLRLLSLPSFLYLFILPTPFIRARSCTQPPPCRSRSRRSQHLAQKLLNPKLPQLLQGRRRRRDGEEDVFGVRR